MHVRLTSNGQAHSSSDSIHARNGVKNTREDDQPEHVAAKGVASAAATDSAEGAGQAAEDALTREEVVHEFFTYLFPDTFQLALPVLRHKVWPPCTAWKKFRLRHTFALHHCLHLARRGCARCCMPRMLVVCPLACTALHPTSVTFALPPQEVDLLLVKWDKAAKALEIAEAAYEASELTTRPTALVGGCCCFGRTKVLCRMSHCLENLKPSGQEFFTAHVHLFPEKLLAALHQAF